MALNLGSISSTLQLNVSGFRSGINDALQSVNRFRAESASAFDGIDRGAQVAAQHLNRLSQTSVDIKTTDAVSSLDAVATHADDAAAAVSSASGVALDVDTSGAVGALDQIEPAAQDAAAAVEAASGTTMDVDSTPAVESLGVVGTAAAEAAAAVEAAGGVVFGLDESDALAGLSEVAAAAQAAAVTIRSASGGRIDVDTGAALANLERIGASARTAASEIRAASGQAIAISVTKDDLEAAMDAVEELRESAARTMTAAVTITGLGELQQATSQALQTRQAIEDIGDADPNVDMSDTIFQLQTVMEAAEHLQSVMSGLGRIGLGAGLAGLFLTPLVQGIQNAAALEQSLKNVQVALGNVSDTDMSRLSTSIKTIGADTQYSAGEIAEVAEALAKAGYDASAMLDGKMLPAVANLAAATGSDLNTAVTGVVQSMAMWSPAVVDASIAMTDASRAADMLTVAANSSSADIEDIIAGMRNMGPVVSQLGVGFDEASAAIAVFTNYGLSGADAGISLARGLQNLQDPTSEAAIRMDELGIAAFDTNEQFVGFPALFGQLSNALSKMSQEQRFAAISTLFGAEAQDAYALAVSMGQDPLIAIIDLMGEQNIAAEQAAARTETLEGAYQRLSEGINNALIGMADYLVKPLTALADLGSEFTDVFALMPQSVQTGVGALTTFIAVALSVATTVGTLRAGLAAMNTTFTEVTGIARFLSMLKTAVTAIAGFQIAIGAVTVAAGPLLLVLGALAVAGVGVWTYWNSQRQEAHEMVKALDELTEAQKRNNEVIADRRMNGLYELADNMERVTKRIRSAIDETNSAFTDSSAAFDSAFASLISATPDTKPILDFFENGIGKAALDWAANGGDETMRSVAESITASLETGMDEYITSANTTGGIRDLMTRFYAAFMIEPTQRTEIENALEGVYQLFEQPDINPVQLNARVDELISQYLTGATPNVQGFIEALSALKTEMGTVAGQATVMQNPLMGMGDAAEISRHKVALLVDDLKNAGNFEGAVNIERMSKAMVDLDGKLSDNALSAYGDAMSRIQSAMQDSSIDGDRLNAVLEAQKARFEAGTITDEQYANSIILLSENTYAFKKSADDTSVSAEELEENLGNLRDTITEISGIDANLANVLEMGTFEDDAMQLAANIQRGGQALDDAFRVIVSNTEAIKSQFQSLFDWADELIAEEGVWSRMDDLLDAGLISGEHGVFTGDTDYANAQQAYNSLKQLNGEVANYVDALQVKLAPQLADIAEKQAKWVEELYNSEDGSQLATLGWMDQSEAARAYELATMAADAASGKFGATGLDMATKAIAAAAAADPVLAAMLEDMGLISYGSEGEIIVDTSSVEAAKDPVKDLNDAIRTLTDLLDDGKINGSVDFTVNGTEELDDATDKTNALPEEKEVNVDVEVTGEEDVTSALDNIPDSKTVTISIATATASDETYRDPSGIDGPFVSTSTPSVPTVISTQIEAVDNATPKINDVASALQDLPDTKSVVISASTGAARLDIGTVQSALDSIEDVEVQVTVHMPWDNIGEGGGAARMPSIDIPDVEVNVTVDTGTAVSDLEPVASALDGLEDVTVTISTVGAEAAIGLATSVKNALDDLEDVEVSVSITQSGDTDVDTSGLSLSDIEISVSVDTGTALDDLKTVVVAQSEIDTTMKISIGTSGADFTLTKFDELTKAIKAISQHSTVTITFERPGYTELKGGLTVLSEDLENGGLDGTVTITFERPGYTALKGGLTVLSEDLENGGLDGTVTITFQDSGYDDVRTEMFTLWWDAKSGLYDASVTLSFEMEDSSGFESALSNLTSGETTSVSISISGDASSLTTAVTDAQTAVDDMTGTTVAIWGDVSLLMFAVGNGQDAVDGMAGRTIDILGDVTDLTTEVNTGQQAVDDMTGTTVSIWGDISILLGAVDNGQSAVDGMYGTTVTIAGDVTLLRYAVSNAISLVNSIPDRTVSITYSTTTVPAQAVGGPAKSPIVELAEQGPELVRMPDGALGLASTRGVYGLPTGSYVYTAAETSRMIGDLAPVPGYASGGLVRAEDGSWVPASFYASTPSVSGSSGTLTSIAATLDAYMGNWTPQSILEIVNGIKDLSATSLKNNEKTISQLEGWQRTLANYKDVNGNVVASIQAQANALQGVIDELKKKPDTTPAIDSDILAKLISPKSEDFDIKSALSTVADAIDDYQGEKTPQSLVNLMNKIDALANAEGGVTATSSTIAKLSAWADSLTNFRDSDGKIVPELKKVGDYVKSVADSLQAQKDAIAKANPGSYIAPTGLKGDITSTGTLVDDLQTYLDQYSDYLNRTDNESTAKKIDDIVTSLKELDPKNDRLTVEELTKLAEELDALKKADGSFSSAGRSAAKAIRDQITALTTGGIFDVEGGTETYGRSTAWMGSKTPTKTPTKTPNRSATNHRVNTTVVTNNYALTANDLADLLEKSSKGSAAHDALVSVKTTYQTSSTRTTGVG